jgi:hypothetical protein
VSGDQQPRARGGDDRDEGRGPEQLRARHLHRVEDDLEVAQQSSDREDTDGGDQARRHERTAAHQQHTRGHRRQQRQQGEQRPRREGGFRPVGHAEQRTGRQ